MHNGFFDYLTVLLCSTVFYLHQRGYVLHGDRLSVCLFVY